MPPRDPRRRGTHLVGAVLIVLAGLGYLGDRLEREGWTEAANAKIEAAETEVGTAEARLPPALFPSGPAPQAVYVVRSGDALTSIAAKFGTTPESIRHWNQITYGPYVGQRLVIRPGERNNPAWYSALANLDSLRAVRTAARESYQEGQQARARSRRKVLFCGAAVLGAGGLMVIFGGGRRDAET